MMRIGIDTGGTFTDLVVLGRVGVRVHKDPFSFKNITLPQLWSV
jgi:N-methylhydantoinase A/oxoprolinase/acetone carboxylase beta subunit